MNDAPSQSQDKFIVRLPDGMREKLKAAAEANHRSMNAEVVAAIEAHLSRQRFAFDPGPPLGPDDYDIHEEYDPANDPNNTLTPEVRAAMETVIRQITDDATRRLNEWLWLEGPLRKG